MKLNDSITTYDIAEALQGEAGKFEVTSPNGERYYVTCQPGHSIVNLEVVSTDFWARVSEAKGREESPGPSLTLNVRVLAGSEFTRGRRTQTCA